MRTGGAALLVPLAASGHTLNDRTGDMGRLTALPGRLSRLPSRIAAAPKRADPFYLSAEWKALRAAKRGQGPAFCRVCGCGGRLILDHRVERKDGGADLPSLDQLDWYCTAHHNAKTAAAKAARARGDGVGGGRKSGRSAP
ncbi:hypothetical protein ACWPMX_07850 [Tsuneonella sp. HG094]